MKCLVFKGTAPFILRGAWGELTIESGGIITRCDDSKWKMCYQEHKKVIDDFVSSGYLVFSDTKDKDTYRDDDVSDDAMGDEESKQNKERSEKINDEQIPKEKSNTRSKLEAKAFELGIKFDEKTSNTELKTQIVEALGGK